MLQSLLKILLFFALILAAALGLNALSLSGEEIRLTAGGMEYRLTPLTAVVALAVLMFGAWLFFKLVGLVWAFIRFVLGDETAIDRYFARTRHKKGMDALSQGLLAVAAGEGKQAQAMSKRAAKYLDDPHITRLLAAQAAEVAGDESGAETIYREMLDDDRTRFVGVRGLMRQKLAAGDTKTALLLAQKAYALKPRHVETQNTLLELSTKDGDWKGARGVLKDKRRQGELPQDIHIRRDAVLALQEARDVLLQGSSVSAREAAISAAKASPDLIPAVVLASQTYVEQKDRRNAERLLEKAWLVRPHPDLAAAYARIVPDETPQQRLRRFESLMKKNPKDEETRLLRAELLLANEDFPGARRALGDLAETHPTTRTLSIMAAIERGEGSDDAAVRGWLVKAMSASRGPQWVCDKCDHVMEDWAPVCDNCDGFDTLSWREPTQKKAGGVSSETDLLPLLVGGPKPANDTDPVVTSPAGKAPADMGAPVGQTSDMIHDVKPDTASAPHKAEPSVMADVAPGMVPRESDFVSEPARTITDPEPPVTQPDPVSGKPSMSEAKPDTAKAPKDKALSSETAKDITPTPAAKKSISEIVSEPPVRPDVDLPEDDTLPPARDASNTGGRLVLDPSMPPRPDVEPIENPVRKG